MILPAGSFSLAYARQLPLGGSLGEVRAFGALGAETAVQRGSSPTLGEVPRHEAERVLRKMPSHPLRGSSPKGRAFGEVRAFGALGAEMKGYYKTVGTGVPDCPFGHKQFSLPLREHQGTPLPQILSGSFFPL